MVVGAMALLLMASMVVMLYYAKRAVKEEALAKASQRLEATVLHIDNILLSVEQTAGNVYFSMLPHLGESEKLMDYCRQVVEANRYVTGCAIAFRHGYYANHPYSMTYVYRGVAGSRTHASGSMFQVSDFSPLVSDFKELTAEDGEYINQTWFATPMQTGKPGWQKPMTGDKPDRIPVVTFCLPILTTDGSTVGVMGVGVSLSQLSDIMVEAKPSAHSYCTLLDGDGSFIVRPSDDEIFRQTAITLSETEGDDDLRGAVKAMLSGETGYRQFRLWNDDYYVFYKPYRRLAVAGRTMEALNWSTGTIYPEDDILGDYKNLTYYVLAIAVAGLLMLFVLCGIIIHRQLMPLQMLAKEAQHIAQGRFVEPIAGSHREDEIGRLQNNFKQMQLSLATNIGELEQLTAKLEEHGEGLKVAYQAAQKADRMKTAFLHNMTNQMVAPADAIDVGVKSLASGIRSQVADEILHQGNTIAELLQNLISMSDVEDVLDVNRQDADVEKGGEA